MTTPPPRNSLEAELQEILRQASLHPLTDIRLVADEIAVATATRVVATDAVTLLREDRSR